MTFTGWLILFIAVVGVLAYRRSSLWLWTGSILVYLLLLTFFSNAGVISLSLAWAVFLVLALPLNILPFRRQFITRPLLSIYRSVLPTMSRTEREALEAGTVGWEGEVFAGKPNWKIFSAYPAPKLSEEEQAFLDGPVEELCRMSDNWNITHNLTTLPPELWSFIKTKGFFGMIIPKQYGGKEFSALAHSAVITKLAGRSISVATTVGVPNSLGPAELLLHYGTEAQKNYYLPRLARGEEVPCFALTGPKAGSDASNIPDYGIVCRGQFEGKEVLGMRVTWDKRYITLAPVATVLGLAFKLYDPDHLLGSKEDLGITCALIPTSTPGVKIGRRHFPVNCAFLNGPTQGHDVFVPMDWIIGGQNMVGQGWRMLMESLSAGRAISLPSTVMGSSKIAAYATGAYSRIRRQFGMSIGRFEGVDEVLSRIIGNTYIMDALRLMTVAAVDRGEKPAVASAISKYHATELGRKVGNDAMDIHGGKGICLGPRNYVGRPYEEIPIAITVEGANILTRCMIIFGQGAIRCHPYVLQEMKAAKNPDQKQGLIDFDKAFFAHIGFTISNVVRSFWLAITGGIFAFNTPDTNKRYFQKITRLSASFALAADLAMFSLGGSLKRRERLSARLGDVLSALYMASSVLKHYDNQGRPEEDMPIVEWACQTLFFQAQQALDGLIKNFPNRFIAGLLRILAFPSGKNFQEPKDELSHRLSLLMITPTQARERLAQGAYITPEPTNAVGKMEVILKQIIAAEDVQRRLHRAKADGTIKGITFEQRVADAVTKKIVTAEEAEQALAADKARLEVYAVDDFAFDELGRVPVSRESIMKA